MLFNEIKQIIKKYLFTLLYSNFIHIFKKMHSYNFYIDIDKIKKNIHKKPTVI